MSVLFFLIASAVAVSIEERVEALLAKLHAPRPRRPRQYKFN